MSLPYSLEFDVGTVGVDNLGSYEDDEEPPLCSFAAHRGLRTGGDALPMLPPRLRVRTALPCGNLLPLPSPSHEPRSTPKAPPATEHALSSIEGNGIGIFGIEPRPVLHDKFQESLSS